MALTTEQLLSALMDTVDVLTQTIGVWPECDTSEMKQLFESGRYGDCIAAVKNHFGLPMRLRICYYSLKDEGSEKRLLELILEESNSVFAVDIRTLNSLASIPMLVLIPPDLPEFGTEALENATVRLFVNKLTLELPFYCFAHSTAHEMAHILLKSLRHRFGPSELATEIVPLLRGFSREVIANRIYRGISGVRGLSTEHYIALARYLGLYD